MPRFNVRAHRPPGSTRDTAEVPAPAVAPRRAGALRAAVLASCLLSACQSPPPATEPGGFSYAIDPALGVRWGWQRTITPVERIDAADPNRYTLLLRPDGRAEVQFDCNRGGGSYEISEGRITFGPFASTRMACPPGSQDAVYTTQLKAVTSFFMQNGVLFLEMPMDSGTMRFERIE
jgi:heat shock protein HslJ